MTAAVVAVSLILLLSSCGVPLAPGYQIQRETLTVHFVAGNPPHLSIHCEYRLANIGNSSLHFIAVVLPSEKGFGRASLHAEIDGKEIAPQQNPAEAADDWRVPLPAPWRQKEKRNLSLSYDLAAQPASDPRIFLAANTFYLNDSGWFPQLLGFKGLFAPSPTRPDRTVLNIIIPADFRVTASGQLRGKEKRNGEVNRRFLIRKADFDPYVLAGQYQEQKVSAGGATVPIWSSNPVASDRAQHGAAQIAEAQQFYSRNFSPLPRSIKQIYDIVAPIAGRGQNVPWNRSALPGVVFDWPSGSEKPLAGPARALGPMDLAQTWFSHLIVPRPEAWTLGGALSLYAVTSLNESVPSATTRGPTIRSILNDYDSNRSNVVEKPILSLAWTDPEAQLALAGDKMQLFFFTLEDKCGQQNVTHAIHDMVYALRGQQYDYSDFRAALEQACHRNLADVFRTWLAQPGIPPDFRARYEDSDGNQK